MKNFLGFVRITTTLKYSNFIDDVSATFPRNTGKKQPKKRTAKWSNSKARNDYWILSENRGRKGRKEKHFNRTSNNQIYHNLITTELSFRNTTFSKTWYGLCCSVFRGPQTKHWTVPLSCVKHWTCLPNLAILIFVQSDPNHSHAPLWTPLQNFVLVFTLSATPV